MKLQKSAAQHSVCLQRFGQWESIARTLLNVLKGSALLCFMQRLLDGCLYVKPAQPTQALMSSRLVDAFNGDLGRALIPTVLRLASSANFDELEDGLVVGLSKWLMHHVASDQLPTAVIARLGFSKEDATMLDEAHQPALDERPYPSRARKRRRLLDGGVGNAATVQLVGKLLTGVETEDLAMLSEVAPGVYSGLNDGDQCTAWLSLFNLSAVHPDPTALLRTASRLLDTVDLQESKRQRVLSLKVVQTLIARTDEATFLDLGSSTIGQYCFRCLHSSLRELRLAAAQCLPGFLRRNLPEQLLARNQQIAFQYLRTLSDRNMPSELETLISAWGHVASVAGDAELNLILLQLVDLLGHVNPLVCGLAFVEIENIAAMRKQSARDLFEPYWPSVAVSVVQDLQQRPQKLQQLCDMLGMEVKDFLLLTQHDTVPALVLHRRKDILQRIAAARGDKSSVQDVCLQPRTNMAAIVALLLVQPGADPEDFAMQCLAEVAPGFRGIDLGNVIKTDPALVACRLLMFIGDQPPARKSRAYQAFSVFANLSERKPGQTKAHGKSSKTLAAFFEAHLLGIMTYFSDVLAGQQQSSPTPKKLSCLHAIADMVVLAKGDASSALPQMRACLQSAIEHPELCEAAWTAWLTILPVLDSEDIALIADQTFALIVRHWSHFSAELQQTTHERVAEMVQQHNTAINDVVMMLPSLSGIPLLSKLASEIDRLKGLEALDGQFKAFARRLKGESQVVVLQALKELLLFLLDNQGMLHDNASSEQPDPWLADLVRSLLDVLTTHGSTSGEIMDLCGKSLGIVGCLDPNRIDASKPKGQFLVLSNFDKASETVEWVVVLLEDVLVKAFKSVTNARAQGFLAYVMQELLRFCGFNDTTALRPRATQGTTSAQRWMDLPEHVRTVLTPMLTSRYVVTSNAPVNPPNRKYPGFTVQSSHDTWLRSLVFDLMWKGKGDNPQMVFPLLARIVRNHDLSIAAYLLPYALTNVVIGGTVPETKGIQDEILAVLSSTSTNSTESDAIRLSSESVFGTLDYMSVWLQEKRKTVAETRNTAYRTGQSPGDFDEIKDLGQIESVEKFLASIPAELVANRAIECGSYSRALFNWEQFIRQSRPLIPSASSAGDSEDLYDKLLDIYANIDEPDGLEGISAHLSILSDEQQATLHARSGRWTAAQAWYEMQLADNPNDVELQTSLLSCFRESDRYPPLLKYADSFLERAATESEIPTASPAILSAAVEAAYMSVDLPALKKHLAVPPLESDEDFALGLGKIVLASSNVDDKFEQQVNTLRKTITSSISAANAGSLQSCHTDLKKLHILQEVDSICDPQTISTLPKQRELFTVLAKRLNAVGSHVSGKQSILGIRRALIEQAWASDLPERELGASWLTTARLARKAGNTEAAYNAVLRAYSFNDKAAKLEEARLLWHDGHGRQAIQALEGAIASGVFDEETESIDPNSEMSRSTDRQKQNMLLARAHLLLAKWLDASGQTQTKDMTVKYQYAAKTFQRWEKGHYYLGKHYQKLLDAEKALPPSKQSPQVLCGELSRLVVENLLRSIPFGNKYWHETIPKVLTLWLDLGNQTVQRAQREDRETFERRTKNLQSCIKHFKKYFDRVPPYIFYQALPQMLSRISHPHPEVWRELSQVITKIASTHPAQALWSLLAVTKATDRARSDRAVEIVNRLKDPKLKAKGDGTATDLRMLIVSGQRLSDGLLHASEAHVEGRTSRASLSRDLGFNHKLAPCNLVVPMETTLTASMPPASDSNSIRQHKAFAQDRITIQSFQDDVLVLSSLQRPKKVVVRGSDGKPYGLLCKPKDDLRKDQRLMEFNGVINRALKRDAESSKRRLYIKTYAVTPLSEESGILEWVEGIKPIRDILLQIYLRKNIKPNYGQIRNDLNEACKDRKTGTEIFNEKVQSTFPASLHEWFTETFPEPETWFAARLRYARTAAVMSMTGFVLGLGDRHGENILLQESTGGVFHVDFNCLFDKGLTFEKPEVVPFRLTRNMVDAMGPYGYEGPFRRSSELTLGLLRQNKDTLNTILETFLYDPTTDFVGKKKRHTEGVPETPQEILDSVEKKLKGFFKQETVPLSVEGYVDALIREAVDPWNLAQMYIGWCAFL